MLLLLLLLLLLPLLLLLLLLLLALKLGQRSLPCGAGLLQIAARPRDCPPACAAPPASRNLLGY